MAKEEKTPEARLPAEVAEKYDLKMIRPGKYYFNGFGEIDLRKVTLKQVEALKKKGFYFFEEKKQPESKKVEKPKVPTKKTKKVVSKQ